MIQRALRVLDDSKSRQHIIATREVIYIDGFRKDVERSEARQRKIRKELARLDQGQFLSRFCECLNNDILSTERRHWRRDVKTLDAISYNVNDINAKLDTTLVDKAKYVDLDDRLRHLETTVNRYFFRGYKLRSLTLDHQKSQ